MGWSISVESTEQFLKYQIYISLDSFFCSRIISASLSPLAASGTNIEDAIITHTTWCKFSALIHSKEMLRIIDRDQKFIRSIKELILFIIFHNVEVESHCH